MPTQIQRCAQTCVEGVEFAATVETSNTICLSNAAAFTVFVPSTASATTITWYASHADGGPYFPVTLSSGSGATTAVVASRAYIAPPELFACSFIRGVALAPFKAIVVLKT